MKLMVVAAVALTVGCAGTWSDRAVTASYVASTALVACDMGQTIWASNNGRWDRRPPDRGPFVEDNPVYGERPGVGLLLMVAAANAILGSVVLNAPIPKWVKLAWFGGLTAVEVDVVVRGNWIETGLGACGITGQRPTVTGPT